MDAVREEYPEKKIRQCNQVPAGFIRALSSDKDWEKVSYLSLTINFLVP